MIKDDEKKYDLNHDLWDYGITMMTLK